MIKTLSFGSETEDGRARRDRTMIEVMDEWVRHCCRTTLPIEPVDPVCIIFILNSTLGLEVQTKTWLRKQGIEFRKLDLNVLFLKGDSTPNECVHQ